MIQICRAEDGHLIQVNATLRDIERTGSLEVFLEQETGISKNAVLAFLSDGRRLSSSNIRELAGAHDQTIFVYNKNYLDYDIDDVLGQLLVEPPLQPPVGDDIAATPPFRPSQLADAYLHTAQAHVDNLRSLVQSLQYQNEAVRIASTSLDLNVLAILDTFEGLSASCSAELEKQASLLGGLEADLDIIRRVRVHTDFVSPTVRKAIESGEKHRTLGDYVSNVKMMQVAETCAKSNDDLRGLYENAHTAVSDLQSGTAEIRSFLTETSLLDGADSSLRQGQELLERSANRAAALSDPSSSDSVIPDLAQFDEALRNEIIRTTQSKNAYTEKCLVALKQISILNADMTRIPPMLVSLQEAFRAKRPFVHISRLHNMLYAYGATVVEIVRRKEFARFFYQRAQSILEVMAKLSSSERKRRQVYRSELNGQLPFTVTGMEDPVPEIDFSTTGGREDPVYSIDREDIDGLMHVLDDLEHVAHGSHDDITLRAIRECKAALEKQIAKMDGLEAGFDKIAERSLLSASRLSQSRRHSVEADEKHYHDLVEQLRQAEEVKLRQQKTHEQERRSLKSDLERTQLEADADRARADELEKELTQVRSQLASESSARRSAQERHSETTEALESQRQQLSQLLRTTSEQGKNIEQLELQLTQARAQYEEMKTLEASSSQRVQALVDEQSKNLRILEEARSQGKDLQGQIRSLRDESEGVNEALKAAGMEKDRLLRAQSLEHDRIMRDHRAEADGDRAVLERQFFELKAVHEKLESDMRDLKSDLDVANADAAGLREELRRVERELANTRKAEHFLKDSVHSMKRTESTLDSRLEHNERLVAQMLDVASAFRTSHLKAMSIAQALSTHPSSSKQANGLVDSLFSPPMRHSIIGQPEEPSPMDHSDPGAALEILRAFDHDVFLETISKTGSTIRKWQKQCKEYRERAKGKISFRNFTKGDLALFLPTRNSVSKPWAAFNVSFPHYFLQATGHLAEQLKTREWIVARITSITERIVDQHDSTSNPYGLGDGVKYYMLEVEDWTQPGLSTKRRSSNRKSLEQTRDNEKTETKPMETLASLDVATIPASPPEAIIEDTFQPSGSHAFSVRTRESSSPNTKPSSLSRLLAQAPPTSPPAAESESEQADNDTSLEAGSTAVTVPDNPRRETSPFPTMAASPPAHPPSSGSLSGSIPKHVSAFPSSSPLRPGSRTSRLSTTSRFSISGGRPVITIPNSASKAAPTIAISGVEQPFISSPSSGEQSADNPPAPESTIPSPEGSISQGFTNATKPKQRTASYHTTIASTGTPGHIHRSSPLAASESSSIRTVVQNPTSSRTAPTTSNSLSSFTSGWANPFARKRRSNLPESGATESTPDNARDILRQF